MQGNLTIEVGARVTGQVRASTVIVGGELHGNIEAASRVELQETGMVVGDVKAGSLTVAAGSRMRGQVEFGWGEKGVSSLASAKVDAAVSSIRASRHLDEFRQDAQLSALQGHHP